MTAMAIYGWLSQNLLMAVMTIDGWLTKPIIYGNDYRYTQPRIYCGTRCPSMASDVCRLQLAETIYQRVQHPLPLAIHISTCASLPIVFDSMYR